VLDELMGYPYKPVNDFGQPPITFPGIFGLWGIGYGEGRGEL
jgi:hypothetical protein